MVPMRSRGVVTLTMLALSSFVLAGCIGNDPGETVDLPSDVDANPSLSLEPELLVWEGRVVHGVVDILMHQYTPELVLFDVQPAGFLMEFEAAPEAIEVRVDWTGDGAGFRLHPHYIVEQEEQLGGDTTYYGYLSEWFTEGNSGCIRIPAEDMAAGVWPMMIHPTRDTMNTDFTITVGSIGTAGTVLPDMHGHRQDGDTIMEDHGWEPCQFLVEPEEVPAADEAA